MSTAPTTHPKMSRSVYAQLPEARRYPFPNPDGTVTVDRLGEGDEYFAVDVELVDGPLFTLGQIVVTTALLSELEAAGIDESVLADVVRRHVGGDWGELSSEDYASNDEALVNGDRILSQYRLGPIRCWAITEWDRSVTTLLRPEDY